MRVIWKILLIAVTATVLSSCGARIYLYSREEFLDKVNLIENSGFEIVEKAGSELPDGWIILNETQNRIFIDDQVAHSGKKSLKIKKPDNKFNLTSDSFDIDPLCSYYCRCFIKADKKSAKPVVFYFFTFDQASRQVDRFSKRIYPEKGWQEVDIITDNMDINSVFGRIVVSIPQESDIDIWLDDIESYTICETELND